MHVRLATPADFHQIGEVTVTAYAEFTLGDGDPYVAKLRDAAARASQAELWLAEEAGQILGSVTRTPAGSPWREISMPGEGEFRMLAVAPAARGHGVGETLVRLMLDRCVADGDESVVLSSLAEMESAHRLYERLGFRRAPDRDWSPVDDVCLIAFQKDLP